MKQYIINKGKHSAKGWNVGITLSKKVEFRVKFDASCLYGDLGDNDNYDINKLCGFSTTWFHHKQSGRVGWRCLDGKTIQLLTYSYNKSKTEIKEHDILGTVEPDEIFFCSVEDTEKEYVYTFRKGFEMEEVVKTDAKQKDWFLFHYILFPYFGGNKKAPHKMNVFLDRI